MVFIVPAHIKEVLVSRYEYVVAEKEVVPDLTDALRLCETCSEWCAQCVLSPLESKYPPESLYFTKALTLCNAIVVKITSICLVSRLLLSPSLLVAMVGPVHRVQDDTKIRSMLARHSPGQVIESVRGEILRVTMVLR